MRRLPAMGAFFVPKLLGVYSGKGGTAKKIKAATAHKARMRRIEETASRNFLATLTRMSAATGIATLKRSGSTKLARDFLPSENSDSMRTDQTVYGSTSAASYHDFQSTRLRPRNTTGAVAAAATTAWTIQRKTQPPMIPVEGMGDPRHYLNIAFFRSPPERM
jgi:hypothetical protein